MNAPSFRLWRLNLILALCLAISAGSVTNQPARQSGRSAPEMPAALRDPLYQTELLWQYGGALTAVEVVGDLAFVGVGQRLVILDISATCIRLTPISACGFMTPATRRTRPP